MGGSFPYLKICFQFKEKNLKKNRFTTEFQQWFIYILTRCNLTSTPLLIFSFLQCLFFFFFGPSSKAAEPDMCTCGSRIFDSMQVCICPSVYKMFKIYMPVSLSFTHMKLEWPGNPLTVQLLVFFYSTFLSRNSCLWSSPLMIVAPLKTNRFSIWLQRHRAGTHVASNALMLDSFCSEEGFN